MNERINTLSLCLTDPDETAALGALVGYIDAIFDMTIVAVSVAPLEDDAGATLDIDDDGSNVITAIDASDANVPGTWKSSHVGGTNAPVHVAAGSKLAFDLNSAAAANVFHVVVWYVIGEVSA